jgi:hypothetical protein
MFTMIKHIHGEDGSVVRFSGPDVDSMYKVLASVTRSAIYGGDDPDRLLDLEELTQHVFMAQYSPERIFDVAGDRESVRTLGAVITEGVFASGDDALQTWAEGAVVEISPAPENPEGIH